MALDEALLLDKAQTGDREALSRLLIGCEVACFSLALHLAGNAADAEDLCQDAMTRAAERVVGGGVRDFRPWLLSIVVSVHRNRVDSEAARRRRERGYAMERDTTETRKPSAAERDELRWHLGASLRQLDEGCRLPIILHYEQGLSYAQAATVLSVPEGTVATNIRRGLEELRGLMAKAGYSAAAPVVVAALQQVPAVSVPGSLTAFISSLAAGACANASATAAGTMAGWTAPGWKVAAGVSLAVALGAGGFAGWKLIRPSGRPPVAAEPSPADRPTPAPTHVPVAVAPPATDHRPTTAITLIPRTCDALTAFRALEERGGPAVIILGKARTALLVPVELRFQELEGRKLIEAVAAMRGLRLAWARDGKVALLYEGVADVEIERVRKDMASADPAVRSEAAWRAGWLGDVRAVPLLVKAARDADAGVARQAAVGLRRATWDAVLALDDSAMDLATADADSGGDGGARALAIAALGRMGGEKALASLEKALADQDVGIRRSAVGTLGRMSEEKAAALLKKAQADRDASVSSDATSTLFHLMRRLSGEDAQRLADEDLRQRKLGMAHPYVLREEEFLAFVEKGWESGQPCPIPIAYGATENLTLSFGPARPPAYFKAQARLRAVRELGVRGGEKELALLERLIAFKDPEVRKEAADALRLVGSAQALALVEKAIASQDDVVRHETAYALRCVRGEKGLALIEKALANQDAWVRSMAASTLSRMDGEKWPALIDKALADQDANVRSSIVCQLAYVGGEKARALLERMLADQDANVRSQAANALGKMGGDKARDLLLQQLAADEDANAAWSVRGALLESHFAGDPKVAEALRDFKLPKPKSKPQPQREVQAPPEVF